MSWRTITLFVMGISAAVLIGWDIVVATNNIQGDTISEITLDFVRNHPLSAFSVWFWLGVVCGHLFWPQRVK